MRYSRLHREMFERESEWPRRRMVNPPAWLAVLRASENRFNPIDHMFQVQRKGQRLQNGRVDWLDED